LSACLGAAPPLAPSCPSTEARAARLKKFEREQLIVDYLNRGVSVAEIAAQVGTGEKRMRAVVRGSWRSRSAGSTRRCSSPLARASFFREV
jgi:transposase-like protein